MSVPLLSFLPNHAIRYAELVSRVRTYVAAQPPGMIIGSRGAYLGEQVRWLWLSGYVSWMRQVHPDPVEIGSEFPDPADLIEISAAGRARLAEGGES